MISLHIFSERSPDTNDMLSNEKMKNALGGLNISFFPFVPGSLLRLNLLINDSQLTKC